MEDFRNSRVTVLAIGPDGPEANKKLGHPFPVLADETLEVAKKYGLFHEKGMMGRMDVPRPATILLDKGRRIRWIRTGENIRIRPEPGEIFEELRK
jgi:peroxiredoxin